MIIREMRRGGKNVQGSTVVLCAFVRVILRKKISFFFLCNQQTRIERQKYFTFFMKKIY